MPQFSFPRGHVFTEVFRKRDVIFVVFFHRLSPCLAYARHPPSDAASPCMYNFRLPNQRFGASGMSEGDKTHDYTITKTEVHDAPRSLLYRKTYDLFSFMNRIRKCRFCSAVSMSGSALLVIIDHTPSAPINHFSIALDVHHLPCV